MVSQGGLVSKWGYVKEWAYEGAARQRPATTRQRHYMDSLGKDQSCNLTELLAVVGASHVWDWSMTCGEAMFVIMCLRGSELRDQSWRPLNDKAAEGGDGA